MKKQERMVELRNEVLSIDRAKRVFDALDASETTRNDYRARIGLFIRFIRESGLNRNSFLDFKRDLAKRVDIGTATKNKYLAAARVFLKELNRRGALPVDITQNIKGFKQLKKHKKDGLNDQEISLLLDAIKNFPPTLKALRIKAIFALLALQGLREIEISRLNVGDLDLRRKIAFIWGKGRDDREVIHLHPETVKAMEEYLEVSKIADGALFQSTSNNSKNKRLTTRSIRSIIKSVLQENEIYKSVHGFRHWFTTKLVKNFQGDLLNVAKFTRHRSLEMLQIYYDDVKLQEDLPKFFETFKQVNF